MPVVKKSSSTSTKVITGGSSSSVVKRSADTTTKVIPTSTSVNNITSKETSVTIVQPTVEVEVQQPQQLRNLTDVSFGVLDDTKDGFMVTFNETTNKFELLSPDDLLVEAVADNDLPDQFVEQVVEEASSLTGSIDGGSFT